MWKILAEGDSAAPLDQHIPMSEDPYCRVFELLLCLDRISLAAADDTTFTPFIVPH